MSQKRVKFDLDKNEKREESPTHSDENSNEQPSEDDAEDNEDDHKIPFNKRFKHTLDSDEEDDEVDEEKYNFLSPEKFMGEEEGAARVEDDVKLTPFNMNEELEEGHFDKDGTYIFRKDRDEIHDNWLDNIDWMKVQTETKTPPIFLGQTSRMNDKDDDLDDDDDDVNDDDDSQESLEKVNVNDCLSRLLPYLKPGETVQKAMQRLHKGRLSVTQKMKLKNLKKKGAKLSEQQLDQLEKEEQISKEVNVISELADKLATQDSQIYQKTYESIEFLVEKEKEKSKYECSDDMFADDIQTAPTSASPNSTVEVDIKE